MSKTLIDSLLDEINAGNMDSVNSKVAELSDDDLNALFDQVQPYKALGTATSNKFVLGSVSNMREKYLKKLITTAMVGFLFQMKDEYNTDECDLKNPPSKEDFMEEQIGEKLPENFSMDILYNEELAKLYTSELPKGTKTAYKDMEAELTEEQLMIVNKNANARYEQLTTAEKVLNAAEYGAAMEAAIEKQSVEEREIIERYLTRIFKYDEERDSQEGKQPIVDDPERVDVETLKGTHAVYDNIPPNDTHCRFNAYYDINYEQMREATKNIYNIKPDLEHAMIVYDVLDTQKEVDSFIGKYGANSKFDILSFPLNQWTLMGPFKENRKRVDYYNKHNAIIKSMLDQQETDAALGEDLMKKRIKSKKIKAEKVFGKDSEGFAEYKKLSPSELQQKYNATMEELDNGDIKVSREILVNAETGKEIEVDEDGVPLSGLEVPITSINAKTGETTQTRFFTAGED